jgi:ADP-ribose pyrophosphatase
VGFSPRIISRVLAAWAEAHATTALRTLRGSQFVPHEPEILLETSRFRVVRQSRQLDDGTVHSREIVVHPGAAVILPLIDADRICLIRNYRVAVDEELIELPAGTIDQGEDPLATARRELLEETGYSAGSLEKLHDFWVSPGILNERMHLFVARDLTPGSSRLERGEEIKTLVVSWSDALDMIDSRRIRDAKTIVGLLFYDRLGDKT